MAPISQLQWIWHSDDAWHPDDAIGMNVAQYAGSGDGKWADSRQPSYYFIRYLSLETKPSAAWLQIYSGCGYRFLANGSQLGHDVDAMVVQHRHEDLTGQRER